MRAREGGRAAPLPETGQGGRRRHRWRKEEAPQEQEEEILRQMATRVYQGRWARSRAGADGIQSARTINVSFARRIISVKSESRSRESSEPHLAMTTPASELNSAKSSTLRPDFEVSILL